MTHTVAEKRAQILCLFMRPYWLSLPLSSGQLCAIHHWATVPIWEHFFFTVASFFLSAFIILSPLSFFIITNLSIFYTEPLQSLLFYCKFKSFLSKRDNDFFYYLFLFLLICRCLHITDIGLGYIATMAHLENLSVRWCPQVRDFGLQALISLRTLRTLSVAGKWTMLNFNSLQFTRYLFHTFHCYAIIITIIIPYLFFSHRLFTRYHHRTVFSRANATIGRTRAD